MKARLLIVNPAQSKKPPRLPTLLLEDQGVVALYLDSWSWRIQVDSLENLRRQDLEGVLHVKPTDIVLFSEIRHLPSDDPTSAEVLTFCQSWWKETMRERKKTPTLAKAS